jgi:dolichol-phosphate mannosyltransferase
MPGTCTIVIPTYNEEKNIANMARAIREAYPEFHVLFMDDNSTDKSKELIEEMSDPMVRLFTRRPEERGLAASVLQGFVECNTDYFICMDCDFQHPISALGPIYKALDEGADLCVGTRKDRMALGLMRWAGSWAFNVFCELYLFVHGKRITEDLMSGLFGGRHDVFAPIITEHWNELELSGWKVLLDLLKFSPRNIKIEKVYYEFGKRAAGESHLSPKVVITSFHQCGVFGKLCARIYAAIRNVDYKSMYYKKSN